MIRRFFRSRGAQKLRRNRWALVSLVIIGAYFLAAAWMMAMDAVQWFGKTTGAYDISSTPVVSTFLNERMLEEAGPPSLGGLGRPIGLTGSLDYIDYFFSRVREGVETVASIDPDSGQTYASVFAEFAVQERRLLDLEPDALLAQLEEGEQVLAKLDDARRLVNAAQTVGVQVRVVRANLATLADPPEDAEIDFLREDVAFAIEDLLGFIESYTSVTSEASSFDDLPTDALLDAVDALYEGADPQGDLAAVLESIENTSIIESDRQQTGVSALIPEAEAAVDELMPIPDGLAGLTYRTRLLLGTDRQGRSILIRAIASGKVAVQVGVIVGLTAVLIGSLLGAAAAFFGGWVDHVVTWLYSIFTSIPQLVLLAVLSFMFLSGPLQDLRGLPSLFIAFAITYWIGPCRVIRGEAMKIKELEYVQAATAIGFGRFYILVKHILPNTLHLMFINFSLLFVGAIKGEVILTFLNLGLPIGEGASWGIMISQAKSEVVQGFFWQIGAATFFMFVLVLAFNILSDALQDAFDPKHVG
ncbi:MAG: ABC transporter permease [Planctomycetota bacterium]